LGNFLKEISPRLGFVISPSRSKLNQMFLKNFVSINRGTWGSHFKNRNWPNLPQEMIFQNWKNLCFTTEPCFESNFLEKTYFPRNLGSICYREPCFGPICPKQPHFLKELGLFVLRTHLPNRIIESFLTRNDNFFFSNESHPWWGKFPLEKGLNPRPSLWHTN
jgi:hypothetical protein